VGAKPCVHVTPDPEVVTKPGSVYVLRGYGWPARARITALYGTYCGGAPFCDASGRFTTFRADRRGRFVFHFRYGRLLLPGIPRPAAAGGGPSGMVFSTRRGVGSDAIPPPPPSTRAQRAEARAIARIVAGTHRALLARRRAVNRAMDEYERTLDGCRDAFPGGAYDTPEGRVLSALIGLRYDEAGSSALLPSLLAYAERLEALNVQDGELRAGVDAMVAAIRREDRPYARPDFCAVVRRWAETGHDMAHAPVRPDDRSQTLSGDIGTSPAIETAGDRLRALGAGPGAQEYWEGAWFNTGEYF
jgi:hypothetical protein